MKNSKQSRISIGMPVFNCGDTVEMAIKSILDQSYDNFELIISDNNSTDATSAICEHYALCDSRISYYRQPTSITWPENFTYVFRKSSGEFFTWAAGDDWKSNNFLKLNLELLIANPSAVASMSPFSFEKKGILTPRIELGQFKGMSIHKFKKFFEIANTSHGMLYSLIRKESLEECDFMPNLFFGWDWALILFLLEKGDIVLEKNAYTIFNTSGVSNSPKVYKIHGLVGIKRSLPYLKFSLEVLKFSKNLACKDKFYLVLLLTRLNFLTAIRELRKIRYFLSNAKKCIRSTFNAVGN